MSAMLKLSGVFKRFGALLAIDNLSMHLDEGEVLGVIGPNGSGKTTMFNILTGITKADQGRVLFEGADITHLQAFERCRRGIARSFQIPRPFARNELTSQLTLLKGNWENMLAYLESEADRPLEKANE